MGDGTIATTDPEGNSGGTGVESLDYPNKWGASGWDVWTDTYNSVRFDVEGISHGDIWLDKLVYGQMDSDSVRRLQAHLNEHTLVGGSTLPISGNLLEQTANELRLCREQHGFADSIGDETVSQAQVEHIIPFATCGCTLIVETTTPKPPDPGDTTPPEAASTGDGFAWTEYSGKPSGTLVVNAGDGYVLLDAATPDPPEDGLELHMSYWHCDLTWDSGDEAGDIRLKYVRDNGDETALQDYTVRRGKEDFLITHGGHWEDGEKGEGGRWWINVGAGISKATITTRYQKAGGVTFDNATIASAAILGTFELGVNAGRRLLKWLIGQP